jgi:exodeoxyribonuclease (lambda-induced)
MEQRTPEWHAARAGRVTASGAGALLGMSPHTSEADGFRRLVRSMHGMESEFVGNVATEYGTFHEDGALVEYCMETGATVWSLGFAEFGNWLGASPDGLIDHNGMVEIKCPFGKRKDNPPEFKSIDDQPHYYAQMQIQMYCTGRTWCDFYQWSPHGTMTERVEQNDEWLVDNIPLLHAIWMRAKAADPADFAGPKRQEYDTPETAKLVAEYDELRDAIDNANDRKKDIIARMVEISGKRDAVIGGRNLTLVKQKGKVSYAKAIAAYAPKADLEPYRGKASEGWQLK